eukprot:TCALIF_04813-PA protein Name:"Similar to FucT6 Alpha-(1,6)-fucosyltransferase (Drosophila melanogaster)" AED:0.32 eAED:0.32 QI:55/0.5/0/0.66/1/1/3/0/510
MLMASQEKTHFLSGGMFNRFTIQRDLQLSCLRFRNSENLREFIPEDVRESMLERCRLAEQKLALVMVAEESKTVLEKIVTMLVEFQIILRLLLLDDPQDLIPPEIISEIKLIDRSLKVISGKVESMASRSNEQLRRDMDSWSYHVHDDLEQLQHPTQCQNSTGLVLCDLGPHEPPDSLPWKLNHVVGCLVHGILSSRRVVIPNLEGLSLNPLISGLVNCPPDVDLEGNANLEAPKLDSDMRQRLRRPFLWYAGAVTRYILNKLDNNLKNDLKVKAKKSGLAVETTQRRMPLVEKTVAGVYLPSTTSSLHICFQMVENYFQRWEVQLQKSIERKVLILPGRIEHLEIIRANYPHYHVIEGDFYGQTADKFSMCDEGAGNGSRKCNQATIFNLMALANADFFVGTLSDEFGRLVYQLRAAIHPDARITSLNYDPGSWYHHGLGGPDPVTVNGNYSTRVWEMETTYGDVIEPTRGEEIPRSAEHGSGKFGIGVSYGTNLATNRSGYISTFKTE